MRACAQPPSFVSPVFTATAEKGGSFSLSLNTRKIVVIMLVIVIM